MRKIEAFKSDDGRVYETRIDCARADYLLAVARYQKAHAAFDECAQYTSAPRARVRNAIHDLVRRLRTVEECLKDLDFHDEDASDPVRIEAAKKEEQRVAVAVMFAVRKFCSATASGSVESGDASK